MASFKVLQAKFARALKLKLKAMVNKNKTVYSAMPTADSHQEEQDENAINEALEARLMELIASAPQRDLATPMYINHPTSPTSEVKVPANLDSLDFGYYSGLPMVQTSFQQPQPQLICWVSNAEIQKLWCVVSIKKNSQLVNSVKLGLLHTYI